MSFYVLHHQGPLKNQFAVSLWSVYFATTQCGFMAKPLYFAASYILKFVCKFIFTAFVYFFMLLNVTL